MVIQDGRRGGMDFSREQALGAGGICRSLTSEQQACLHLGLGQGEAIISHL